MGRADTEKPRTTSPLGSSRPDGAKALLLVILGEFVWPGGQPVWSSILLDALAELDVEPNAARKALHRTSESGLIVAHREGRRVKWSVTPRGDRILSAGYERTYGWDTRDTSWDGRWLLLSVTVPESLRNLRHHLQTRLTWAGLGSPTPGQWLTPHWERGDEVARIVTELGLGDQAHSVVGAIGPVGDEHRLVQTAWDLDRLGLEYADFIATYAGMRPTTDRDCFRSRVALVQDWRRFPYVDPDLPKQFLPAAWPGFEATRVFRDRYNAWKARSTRHWRRLETRG